MTQRIFSRRTLVRAAVVGAGVAGAGVVAGLSGCVSVRAPGPPTKAAAPAFDLTDQRGQRVSLAQLTESGPAVLVFYRGFW